MASASSGPLEILQFIPRNQAAWECFHAMASAKVTGRLHPDAANFIKMTGLRHEHESGLWDDGTGEQRDEVCGCFPLTLG